MIQKAETAPENTKLSTPLEIEEKAKWLSEAIQEGLDRSRKRKREFKTKASVIKIATVFLSGLMTVLLGLQIQNYEDRFKMTAFILGAIVTVLNALEPFFNFRSLWIEHEETTYRLYRLQDDFTFYLKGKRPEELSLERIEEFNKLYAQIWVDVSRRWLELRHSEDKRM